MTHADRTSFDRLWKEHNRAMLLASMGGVWASFEFVSRAPQLRRMATGWRVLSFFAGAAVFKNGIAAYIAPDYQPLIGAFLRKYHHVASADPFDLTDRKREFYQIDTNQYMNYTEDDLKDMHMHANHGPQPVSHFFVLLTFLSGWRSRRRQLDGRIGQIR